MRRLFKVQCQIFAVAALYAAATILVAFVASVQHHDPRAGLSMQSGGAVALCSGVGLAHDGAGDSCSDCCNACLSISASALPPAEMDFSRLTIELKTRIEFARRFGHVSDASPDDLRSRAPPRLS